MCQFKSALVLKDKIFLPDYDNHDKMLQELGIEDNFTNASKVFVRVELSPANGDIFSDVGGWKLTVDQDILPDWWNENEYLFKLKALVSTWMQKHTISVGNREVTGGVWFATGSATVRATCSATVRAYDSATVIIPRKFATDGEIELNGNSVCVNHKTHTIRSTTKWKLEG